MKEIPLRYDPAGVTDILKTGSFIALDVRRGIVYGGKVNLV
jgi:pyruvate kinase